MKYLLDWITGVVNTKVQPAGNSRKSAAEIAAFLIENHGGPKKWARLPDDEKRYQAIWKVFWFGPEDPQEALEVRKGVFALLKIAVQTC